MRSASDTVGVTSPLARLEGAPSDAVAALLQREPPQLVAAVLTRLEPGRAAEILGAMPADRQCTVIRHVGTMTELPAKVLEDVASALASAEVKDAFAKIGAKAEPATPDQLTSYLEQQEVRWAKIVKATGISVDE